MELILNSVVLILLCLAIAYCWKLNGKIQDLQNSRGDIKNLIKSLDSSITSANHNIAELKKLTSTTIIEMSDYIKQSEELSGDLSFLIERARNLADELELSTNKASALSKKASANKSSSSRSLKNKSTSIRKKNLEKS
jgi:predicted  nucleic acid-binding Zn-ribbon protein